jgi:HipA-like protein
MMKRANVYKNEILTGMLTQHNSKSYVFRYDDAYYTNDAMPAVSLTLPKSEQEYEADHLFSCFFNMIAEGVNRTLQARQLRIDEEDYFSLLLATAQSNTIGSVTLKEIEL